MTTEQLNNLFTELSFKPGEEYIFNEIKSILLTNGRIIVPNYLYMRFIVQKNKLGIIYGESEPIGARLPFNYSVNATADMILFPEPLRITETSFYPDFRCPEFSDRLRVSTSLTSFKDYIIEKVQHDSVSTRIKIFGTFTNLQTGKSKLSFYNPGSFDISDCTLGNIDEGIFHHFIKNPLRKNHVCHEEIPFKHIKEIRLKIHGNAYNKKYTVR